MSNQKHSVRISVRNLVEFILKSGDIDNQKGTLRDAQAMQEGNKVHKRIQREGGSNYQAEVPLKIQVAVDELLTICIEGRADGVISGEEYTIDEIKGTYTDFAHIEEPTEVHFAQALCYAYIVAKEKALSEMNVQLTYVHIESKAVKRFTEKKSFEELEQWFLDIVNQYAVWARWHIKWCEKRNASISEVKFPFEYRASQKKLVSGVYRTILGGKKLFVEAPTGTGKTVSTIFPAIKALGEDMCHRIFYLTAKTITRTVAEETFSILNEAGLRFKVITLTAKDKICLFDEADCNPVRCERAKGHFDRVNDAVFDMINHEETFTKEKIEAYALSHRVCPYEMQLDIALWCDTVICDYNYIFDPIVYLRRFFGERKEDYVFLIDEAHNLVDRAREMYSAILYKSHFLEVKRLVKTMDRKLALRIEKCHKYMIDLRDECEEDCAKIEHIDGLISFLMKMLTEMENFLAENHPQEVREKVVELYFEARQFVRGFEVMDERYITYMQRLPKKELMVKIFCVDPSKDLCERLEWGKSTIFFSATLIPVNYYKSLLSITAKEDYDFYVDSPFDTSNRLLLIASDVTSKFTRRNEKEYVMISEYIRKIIRGKNGNYLVFFPSYTFMRSVYEIFTDRELVKAGNGLRTVIQENAMTEKAREEFLDNFKAKTETTMIGFCVLGGIFSEGIDLKEDRLIGAIVVGTGLPMITYERELLKEYFDLKQNMGFDFAFLYPGMNKILQAGGRVIRTEKDRGVIALLDERFNYLSYRQLFPREWEAYKKVNLLTVENEINVFWESL